MLSGLMKTMFRVFDGGDLPFLRHERLYLASFVPPTAVVMDVGGGDGKLANVLAPSAKTVLILDKESTNLSGADAAQYAGSLARARRNRTTSNVIPIRGDAVAMPFMSASLDAIVSSQLLEHLNDGDKASFYRECFRTLKPGGVLAISTPNGECIGKQRFLFARAARRLIPGAWIRSMPNSLRGAWLEQSVEDWELKVGHFDHGCRPSLMRSQADAQGFLQIDQRVLHSRITGLTLQLMFTFPLLFSLVLPLVRFLYWLEWKARPRDGMNIMVVYRKPSASANFIAEIATLGRR